MIINKYNLAVTEDVSVDFLNLSVRSRNAINRKGIFYLSDLLGLSMEDLMKIKNLGKTSINDIYDKVREYLDKELGKGIVSPADCQKPHIVTMVDCNLEQVPIEKLNLSIRPYNCLKSNGINYVSEVLGLSYEELLNFRNMGRKSVDEILKAVSGFTEYGTDSLFNKYKFVSIPDDSVKVLKLSDDDYSLLNDRNIKTIGQVINCSSKQLTDLLGDKEFSERLHESLFKYKEMCVKCGCTTEVDCTNDVVPENQKEKVRDIIISAKKRLAFLNSERLENLLNVLLEQIKDNAPAALEIHDISDIMNLKQVISEYKDYMLEILRKNQYNGMDCTEFRNLLSESVEEKIKLQVERELLEDGKIKLDNDRYFMNYPSFSDFLDESNAIHYRVIEERISGKTLEETAYEMGGLTRERIRQIESKSMQKILKKYIIRVGLFRKIFINICMSPIILGLIS